MCTNDETELLEVGEVPPYGGSGGFNILGNILEVDLVLLLDQLDDNFPAPEGIL